MADEEKAFLNSLQAANEAAEGLDQSDGNSGQQAESNSSDEYDPSKALKADVLSPLNAQFIQVPSLDPSLHDPASSDSTIPVTSVSIPAAPPLNGTQSDHQSLSRSMSPTSSQSSENNAVVTTHQNPGSGGHTSRADEGGVVESRGGKGAVDKGLNSLPPPVSDSSLNNSTNHVSADNVQIQNNVQDHSAPDTVQNSVTDTVPNLAAVIPDTGASSHSESTVKPAETLPAPTATNANASTSAQPPKPNTPAPRARLPHDTIGILEDRIKEDPRGDLQAWLHLINEHKKRGKIDDARNVYERFLSIFPSAVSRSPKTLLNLTVLMPYLQGEQWVSYAQMENEAQNRTAMDKILSRALPQNPYLPLWSMYLDHIRRHNNLTTDSSGQARNIIYQAYDVAMQHVGLDKDSGKLWQDYIQFIKSGPGIIGGSNWQDQQKMDSLRKVYQRAICIPTQSTNLLWKEYDGFEMGLNKITVRTENFVTCYFSNFLYQGKEIPARPVPSLHVGTQLLYRTSEYHSQPSAKYAASSASCTWL